MGKTPVEAMDEALRRLPGARVFVDVPAAVQWVGEVVGGVLEAQVEEMALVREERDAANPIEAGMMQAKEMGLRPRRSRVPWVDVLLDVVAEACGCEVMALRGTLTTWVIGRRSRRRAMATLVAGLVPTGEKLAQDAYYVEYNAKKREGKVEEARGYKERWYEEFVAAVAGAIEAQRAGVAAEYGVAAREAWHQARVEVVEYMNENFLPTRGDKTQRAVRMR